MKKLVCLIITFLIAMPIAFASSCQENPDYKNWLELSDEEKKIVSEPVPYLCYLDANETKKLSSSSSSIKIIETANGLKTVSANDSRFDARDYGVITPVKSQGAYGNCWAYAGNSLFETAAIKSGFNTYDLSEKHVVVNSFYDVFKDRYNVGGFNAGPDDGGNILIYASYAFRHLGPYFENEYPYLSSNPNYEYSNLYSSSLPTEKPLLDLDSIVYFVTSDGCTANKKTLIKNTLLTYGAVGSSINASINMNTYRVNKTSTITNHEIVIVGWDDTIPASKFGSGVTTDGGWIIKNSWGTNKGDNGYYYISYEDALICNETYYFSGVELNNYDNTYYTTEQSLSVLEHPTVNTDTFYESIKMSTKNSNVAEYLGKVSLFLVPGEQVSIYYGKDGPDDHEDFLGSIQSYSFGYTSVEFDEIEVKGDFYINVVHKYSTANKNANYFALSCRSDNSQSVSYTLSEYTGGKYLYSNDGTNFVDTNTITPTIDNVHYSDCRPIVYAYTKMTRDAIVDVSITSIATENDHDVYVKSGDYFDLTLSIENVTDYSLFNIEIYDDGVENNMTNLFNIDMSHITSNHIYITSTTAPAGQYRVFVYYGNVVCMVRIEIKDYITSQTFNIKGSYIYITPVKGTDYTVSYLDSQITFVSGFTHSYKSKTNTSISNSDKVTTESKLRINNTDYVIIILGDVNGDGLIRANDYVRIKNHIMEYSTITDDAEKQAADCNQDGRIRANDYVRIKNYIMGS